MKIIDTSELTPQSILTPNEKSWVYNGLDCCVTLEVRNVIKENLDNVSASTYQFSMSLQAPILEMSMRGVRVNQRRRHQVLTKFREQIALLSDQLNEIVREGVGAPVVDKVVKGETKRWWRSRTQLMNVLYDVMGLHPIKKRNTNGEYAPTVNRDAIEKLSVYFIAEPICNHILALRDLDKKRQFLETEIDPDGRMRTNFNIAGTNTGRLASAMSDFGSGTNLQNVDRDLRSVFIADPEMKFCNIDLEQADSRNLGAMCWNLFHASHGPAFAGKYLDLCESGDLHTRVSMMARPHLPWTTDMKANRTIADQKFYRNDSYRDLDKKLGHGTNFLGGITTMAKHAKVPPIEVRTFQQNYFNALPCIPAYHQSVRDELKETSSLTTLFGRRRFFFGRWKDESTIREAVAYRPQSMTADEIDIAMLNIWRAGRVQLLLQVHDSLLVQYHEKDEAIIVPWLIKMLRVPLILVAGREFAVPAEAKIGWNWGEFDAEKNPDGLVKWKGGDDRKRTDLDWRLSVRGL